MRHLDFYFIVSVFLVLKLSDNLILSCQCSFEKYDLPFKCLELLPQGGCPPLTVPFDHEKNKNTSWIREIYTDVYPNNLEEVENIIESSSLNKNNVLISLETSGLETVDCGDTFVQRIRTYFNVPNDGEYTFLLAANDFARLSVDNTVVSNLTTATQFRNFTMFEEQSSDPFMFTAGEDVLLEIIHGQTVFDCHLTLGVVLPNGDQLIPIPSSMLSYTFTDWQHLATTENQRFENNTTNIETIPIDFKSVSSLRVSENDAHPPPTFTNTETKDTTSINITTTNVWTRLQWMGPSNHEIPHGYTLMGYELFLAKGKNPSAEDFKIWQSTSVSTTIGNGLIMGQIYSVAVRVKYISMFSSISIPNDYIGFDSSEQFSSFEMISFEAGKGSEFEFVDSNSRNILVSDITSSSVRLMWSSIPLESSISSNTQMNIDSIESKQSSKVQYKVSVFNVSYNETDMNSIDEEYKVPVDEVLTISTSIVIRNLNASSNYVVIVEPQYILQSHSNNNTMIMNSSNTTLESSLLKKYIQQKEFTTTIESIEMKYGNNNGIYREIWTSIEGNLETLKSDPSFLSNHSAFQDVYNGPFHFNDIGDFYGQRLRTYYIAPASGTYIFGLSANNFAELYFSNGTNVSAKTMIASVDSWTKSGQFDLYPSQMSTPVVLIAGERYCKYYIFNEIM